MAINMRNAGAKVAGGTGQVSTTAAPTPLVPVGVGASGLSPVTVLLGLIGLMLALKVVGELDSTAIKPAHVSIGGYNVMAVTVTAIVGIALSKLIFTRWRVPGVSDLVQYV